MSKPTPPLVRFMRHVNKTDSCWLWTGFTAGTKSTYGYFRPKTKQTDPKSLAHRWIYEQVVGPIPDGYQIDHLCRTPLCVNPEHLEAVTPAENMRRARKQICKRGHDLTIEENQVFDNLGRRRGCRVCLNMRALKNYHKRKAESVAL